METSVSAEKLVTGHPYGDVKKKRKLKQKKEQEEGEEENEMKR